MALTFGLLFFDPSNPKWVVGICIAIGVSLCYAFSGWASTGVVAQRIGRWAVVLGIAFAVPAGLGYWRWPRHDPAVIVTTFDFGRDSVRVHLVNRSSGSVPVEFVAKIKTPFRVLPARPLTHEEINVTIDEVWRQVEAEPATGTFVVPAHNTDVVLDVPMNQLDAPQMELMRRGQLVIAIMGQLRYEHRGERVTVPFCGYALWNEQHPAYCRTHN